jgi:hypothetical protein
MVRLVILNVRRYKSRIHLFLLHRSCVSEKQRLIPEHLLEMLLPTTRTVPPAKHLGMPVVPCFAAATFETTQWSEEIVLHHPPTRMSTRLPPTPESKEHSTASLLNSQSSSSCSSPVSPSTPSASTPTTPRTPPSPLLMAAAAALARRAADYSNHKPYGLRKLRKRRRNSHLSPATCVKRLRLPLLMGSCGISHIEMQRSHTRGNHSRPALPAFKELRMEKCSDRCSLVVYNCS